LDWLRSLDDEDRRTIGRDLMRAQFRWPVGMPRCRSLSDGLWELRCNLGSNRITRLFFCFSEERLIALPRTRQKVAEDARCRARRRAEAQEGLRVGDAMTKTKKKTARSTKGFTTLDQFLDEEGTREEFQAIAIKEVLAWQLEKAMKSEGLSRARMAERMGTSRSQIGRLLDPHDGNVTIATLQRAAAMLGRKVRLELI
jgi:antitoxin HicB